MRNEKEFGALATLMEYFEKCKAREEEKLDDNYEEATANIKKFNEMLETIKQMDLMIYCEEDFMA